MGRLNNRHQSHNVASSTTKERPPDTHVGKAESVCRIPHVFLQAVLHQRPVDLSRLGGEVHVVGLVPKCSSES